MIAYLDTHTVMRLAHGRPRIGRDAAQLIQRAELLITPMVLVELEYLYEIGRLTLPAKDVLRKLEHELGLGLCDLPLADVARAALDEKWTRDAFDRFIVAQARLSGLAPLISSDEEIAKHYPRTVW
ncbi:MAG TPA: PIN domain-containing protein [Terracidiphilus sp.]|nr:PIN domain-containing protein [Terracidiphilus sp.]